MVRFLLFVAVLLPILGCGDSAPPKTKDPAEIEKIREQHLHDAQRERENK